ncbi:Serine/threonine-protein kinase LATS2, partial [Nibea albiflora]
MRPKTFPAAPYVGNTRQRLQEIKEGLKQPAKLVSQALHGGSSRSEGGRGADCKSGKDTASRQQQLRPPQKFNNYQNALREIRKSLMPFANESGPSSGSGHPAGAGEEMAVRALKQTGSRNIEAALEYISKMGYLDPRNELIVRVIKQTSPGKAGMPNSMDHRPALEASGEAGALPPYHQMGAPMYEGPAGYGPESEMPRTYMSAPPAGLSEAEQEQMRKMLNQKESNYNRLRRAKMDKSMFVKIKTLGIGAFGEVCLTRKVDTGALYAMKTLRKKDVLNRNQVAHVKAERDILAEADNEWVVRLYYSFQDRDSLYFVMDYIPGGDMMSLLIRMGVFPEPLARFYVAELTLAIESVHKMGFIHRDIKPDNILIDLDGHIKLTDFGLCTGFRWTHNSKYYQKGSHVRQDSMEPSDFWDDVSNCRCGDRLMTLEQHANRQHQRCLAHSLVGTPNYIAPEVLLRKGYTQLCDWWSVGVILFEMLVGQPPFLASTPTETQIKVINWESTLQVPAQVKLSPEAVDIIGRLCCSAEDRLGANGAGEIKAHPFFTQTDFSSNLRQQPAPYRPKIAHPMDTSNFDPVEEEGGPGAWSDSGDSTRALDMLCSPHGKHPEHAFYEFTFRRFFDDNGCPFRYPKPLEASEVSP